MKICCSASWSRASKSLSSSRPETLPISLRSASRPITAPMRAIAIASSLRLFSFSSNRPCRLLGMSSGFSSMSEFHLPLVLTRVLLRARCSSKPSTKKGLPSANSTTLLRKASPISSEPSMEVIMPLISSVVRPGSSSALTFSSQAGVPSTAPR
ncbi:hypothetical protein D3C72_680270 [compost metagenome]